MEAAHDSRRQLGQLMVDEGFLTPEQLAVALAEQERTSRPLGKLMVELGFVSAGAVANALAEQHGGLLKTEFGVSAGLHAVAAEAPLNVHIPEPLDRAARIEQLETTLRAVVAERDAYAQQAGELQARLTEQAEQAEPVAQVEVTDEHAHLLFTLSASGYGMVEMPGPAPESGSLLDVNGVRYVVCLVGASPFPESRLRCAFLERV